MRKISFIATARNDGYGGEVIEGNNFLVDRIMITLASMKKLPVESEFLLVEYNPPSDKPRLKELLEGSGIRIVTLNPQLHTDLIADNTNYRIPFYEYVAKEIGIRLAIHEHILICNPENIFPSFRWEYVEEDLDKGIARAVRREIVRTSIKMNFDELINLANKDLLPYFLTSYSAAGDFIGLTKTMYNDLGRYKQLHGGWGIDCDLVHEASKRKIPSGYRYVHFHINHDNAITEVRYPIYKTLDLYKPISQNIVDKFDSYIMEDYTCGTSR